MDQQPEIRRDHDLDQIDNYSIGKNDLEGLVTFISVKKPVALKTNLKQNKIIHRKPVFENGNVTSKEIVITPDCSYETGAIWNKQNGQCIHTEPIESTNGEGTFHRLKEEDLDASFYDNLIFINAKKDHLYNLTDIDFDSVGEHSIINEKEPYLTGQEQAMHNDNCVQTETSATDDTSCSINSIQQKASSQLLKDNEPLVLIDDGHIRSFHGPEGVKKVKYQTENEKTDSPVIPNNLFIDVDALDKQDGSISNETVIEKKVSGETLYKQNAQTEGTESATEQDLDMLLKLYSIGNNIDLEEGTELPADQDIETIVQGTIYVESIKHIVTENMTVDPKENEDSFQRRNEIFSDDTFGQKDTLNDEGTKSLEYMNNTGKPNAFNTETKTMNKLETMRGTATYTFHKTAFSTSYDEQSEHKIVIGIEDLVKFYEPTLQNNRNNMNTLKKRAEQLQNKSLLRTIPAAAETMKHVYGPQTSYIRDQDKKLSQRAVVRIQIMTDEKIMTFLKPTQTKEIETKIRIQDTTFIDEAFVQKGKTNGGVTDTGFEVSPDIPKVAREILRQDAKLLQKAVIQIETLCHKPCDRYLESDSTVKQSKRNTKRHYSQHDQIDRKAGRKSENVNRCLKIKKITPTKLTSTNSHMTRAPTRCNQPKLKSIKQKSKEIRMNVDTRTNRQSQNNCKLKTQNKNKYKWHVTGDKRLCILNIKQNNQGENKKGVQKSTRSPQDSLDNTSESHNRILYKTHTRSKCLMLNSREKEKLLLCHICGTDFDTQTNLHAHVVRVHSENLFTCDVCGKGFKRLETLRSHLTTHSGRKIYECLSCDKTFRQKRSLFIHSIVHTQDKPFVCMACGHPFQSIVSLWNHRRTHVDIKCIHICNRCGREFKLVENLNDHLETHSGEMSYFCVQCNKGFRSEKALNKHAKVHIKERKCVCKICGKKFCTTNNLQNHEKIHTGEKRFCCDTCGMRFGRKDSLQNHIFLHNREKKAFPCTFCDKSFRCRAKLAEHTRIHTNENLYRCADCDKGFTQKGNLERHVLGKSCQKKRDNPYVCNLCGNRYSMERSLRIHAIIHTDEKPFVCKFCNAAFNAKHLLGNHRRLHPECVSRK